MADVHLGAWRDPKMKKLPIEAFQRAIDECIKEKVDFVLIAGDFFNTSLPGIDVVQEGVKQLMKLKENNIPIYLIAGSHDFSTSGKTMLNVLEEAEIVTNVCKGEVVNDKLKLKFTTDKKTGVKLTGMLGRRGTLEKSYYEDLDRESLEKEEGKKIFLFHSAIEELKPKKFEKILGTPASYLPKGFEYYAGGHVHIVEKATLEGYKNIVYPGPIFPASFSEIEELEKGGFYIYDNGEIKRKDLLIKNISKIKINAENKPAERVVEELKQAISNKEFLDAIVLIRVAGKLSSGRVSDINFREIFDKIYEKGAYFVMRNTVKLTTEEFEEIKINSGSVEDIEEEVMKEHSGQIKVSFKEDEITKKLMKALSKEQDESEKKYEYEQRIKEESLDVFN